MDLIFLHQNKLSFEFDLSKTFLRYPIYVLNHLFDLQKT